MKKILLIGEGQDSVRVVLQGLAKADYEVTTASHGEEGLAILQKAPPDLVLLDLNVSGPDGFEVFRRIRSGRRFDRIPIVVLTDSIDPETAKRMFLLGADGYLLKSFSCQTLLTTVENTCRRMSSLQPLKGDVATDSKAMGEVEMRISHELRTALTVILESTSLLSEGLQGPITPEQKGLLDITARNAERLHHLITDLLNHVESLRASLPPY
jgi:DNA-binding response OmpR family regulator